MSRKIIFLPGNHLQLLRNGADYFPALLQEIAAARHEIRMETYIFEDDEIGRQVAAALVAAAQRGVRVLLLIDGFGARQFPDVLRRSLLDAGVWLMFFRPMLRRISLDRSRLRRLHRKLSCFDGRVAFVGGINILSDYDAPDLPARYDYAVRIEGPLVNRIHTVLDREWRHSAWAQLKKDWLRKKPVPFRHDDAYMAGATAAFAIRDNTRNRTTIEQAYLDAIGAARTEIVIANAYFLPGRRWRKALIHAAERGVNVVLLLQDSRDHPLLQLASWAYYRKLSQAGIALYHYKSGFMHAKVAVIDGQWATVGSSNLDPFSLMLAREANIFVRDAEFARQLRDDLQKHLTRDAQAILPKYMENASWWLRCKVWCSFALVRLLMGVSGYGGKQYRE